MPITFFAPTVSLFRLLQLSAAATDKDTGTEGLDGDQVLSPTASMERRG